MSLHDYILSVNRINADYITLEHQKPNKSFSTFSSNVTVQNDKIDRLTVTLKKKLLSDHKTK